jgi:hypothetical protein
VAILVAAVFLVLKRLKTNSFEFAASFINVDSELVLFWTLKALV